MTTETCNPEKLDLEEFFGDGFSATLEWYEREGEDGSEDVNNVWVLHGNYGSSLAVVEAFGTIEDDRGRTMEVPDDVFQEIWDWALENGY